MPIKPSPIYLVLLLGYCSNLVVGGEYHTNAIHPYVSSHVPEFHSSATATPTASTINSSSSNVTSSTPLPTILNQDLMDITYSLIMVIIYMVIVLLVSLMCYHKNNTTRHRKYTVDDENGQQSMVSYSGECTLPHSGADGHGSNRSGALTKETVVATGSSSERSVSIC